MLSFVGVMLVVSSDAFKQWKTYPLLVLTTYLPYANQKEKQRSISRTHISFPEAT